MATTISKLFRTGVLQTSVELDEITHTSVKYATDGVYASEFDEVTMQGSGFPAERKTRDGILLVSGYFDEVDINSPPSLPTLESLFTTPGTYSWTAPVGVTSVSAVCVGGGGAGDTVGYPDQNYAHTGGAGGSLAWRNNIAVTPGETYTVVVGTPGQVGTYPVTNGGASYFIDYGTVSAGGGTGGQPGRIGSGSGLFTGDGGGQGGVAYYAEVYGGGGGGAGGYNGNGGNAGTGGTVLPQLGQPPVTSSGGGYGGNAPTSAGSLSQANNGGGVGLYGIGADGANAGQGGSGGSGKTYGGGGHAGYTGVGGWAPSVGGSGAVRIIWGEGASFPYNAAGITLLPSSLTNGSQDEAYSSTITSSGGTSPYTYVVFTGALPSGISLSSSGVISGTPTVNGTYTFSVKATDAVGKIVVKSYSLVVEPPITLSPTLDPFVGGEPFNETISISGGTPPYLFIIDSGSLPPGIVLEPDGTLTGTPHLDNLTLYPTTLPDTTNESSYSEQVTALGGTSPYTYTLDAGSLPPGITLSSTGSIEGTVSIESPNLTLIPRTIDDAINNSSYSETISAGGGVLPYIFNLEIGILPPGLTLNSNGTISGTVTDNLILSPSSLSGANNGDSYSATITATEGESPYIFAVSRGALPPGLTIDTNGNITGTITE